MNDDLKNGSNYVNKPRMEVFFDEWDAISDDVCCDNLDLRERKDAMDFDKSYLQSSGAYANITIM